MRAVILALVMLIAAVVKASAAPPTINGAWVLSEKWRGHMGIALVIKDNEFKYWFYSDEKLPDEPKYPITGKVEFDSDVIRLVSDENEHLYDTKWRLVVYQGEICLLADMHMEQYRKTRKVPEDRLLYMLDNFDEKKPAMNKPRKSPQPKSTAQPAVHGTP